jgi:hypothetical protein
MMEYDCIQLIYLTCVHCGYTKQKKREWYSWRRPLDIDFMCPNCGSEQMDYCPPYEIIDQWEVNG